MAIIKEYQCAAHGDFEATSALCPHGCGEGMVERVYRTPVGIQTQGFRNMNATLQDVAREQGMSDMNQRGGDGMLRTDWRARRRIADATEMIAYNGREVGSMFKDVKTRFSTSSKPVSAADVVNRSADTRSNGGGLYKDAATGQTIVGPGIVLPSAAPPRGAPSFDGRSIGLPQGDA